MSRLEKVHEGYIKKGKLNGYGRNFSSDQGGNCVVGFFADGKPDGKIEMYDKDGNLQEQGIFSGKECVKKCEVKDFTS